ncbi:MAG: hypothetical protein AXA67_02340 [Methylothermaceae bacteria B42]|nr:MAG: hypothetical protein AXA67_02340 [Methylothermaceae bacteria B42]HHJ39325.1 HupE/UreJ family protein [Methylothermaceae bacterium]
MRKCWNGLLIMAGLPMIAYGHTGGHPTEGLANGFLHPLLGVDHLLSLLAVGWWAALVGGQALWRLPVLFLLAMVFGLGLPIFMGDGALMAMEFLLALSVLWLGYQVASNQQTVPLPALGLMVIFAFVHGYSHKVANAGWANDYLLYGLGLIISSGMVQLIGIHLGSFSRRHRFLRLLFGLGCSGMGVLFLAGI